MHKIILAVVLVGAFVTYRWSAGEAGERGPNIVEFFTGQPTDEPASGNATRSNRTVVAETAAAPPLRSGGTTFERADYVGEPAPALWLAADDDTRLYLFGTIHVLPPDVDWMTPAISNALLGADMVWLETVGGDDPDLILPLIEASAYSERDPLSRYLTSAEMDEIAELLGPYGFTPWDIEAMRPWFADVMVQAVPWPTGPEIVAGADFIVEDIARAAGIAVSGLASLPDHMALFTDIPVDLQVDLLRETLEVVDGDEEFDRTIRAWRSGGDVMLGIPAEDRMGAELYDILIARRNADWVRLMEWMLEEPGDHFIAVGAGHFSGASALQTLLRSRGVAVERIQ